MDEAVGTREFSAFISHSSADAQAAEQIVDALERRGLSCWVAPRNLSPGTEYGEGLIQGIRQSKCFILLLSTSANLSPHVRREVERAASLGKPIYPVRIEDVPPSPKLEFFVSMHHWLDAWDGVLDDHARRLAAAIAADEGWIENKVVRRRRRAWASSVAAAAVLGLIIAGAFVFGSDLRRASLPAAQRAAIDLAARGLAVDAAGVAGAAVAADIGTLTLYREAGASMPMFENALGEPGVALRFFNAARGRADAAEWLADLLADGFDPNLVVAGGADDVPRGILFYALEAGNADAAVALLECGASPYVYRDVWFVDIRKPGFLFPFDALEKHDALSAADKVRLEAAFVAAGALIPLPADGAVSPDLRRNSNYEGLDRTVERLAAAGISPPVVHSICDPRPKRLCAVFAARTGTDWCALEDRLPQRIYTNLGGNGSFPFSDIRPIGLINVVEDRAYVLTANPSNWQVPYGFLEISRDGRTWRAAEFVADGVVGFGSCVEERSYGYNECWRRTGLSLAADGSVQAKLGLGKSALEFCAD